MVKKKQKNTSELHFREIVFQTLGVTSLGFLASLCGVDGDLSGL